MGEALLQPGPALSTGQVGSRLIPSTQECRHYCYPHSTKEKRGTRGSEFGQGHGAGGLWSWTQAQAQPQYERGAPPRLPSCSLARARTAFRFPGLPVHPALRPRAPMIQRKAAAVTAVSACLQDRRLSRGLARVPQWAYRCLQPHQKEGQLSPGVCGVRGWCVRGQKWNRGWRHL